MAQERFIKLASGEGHCYVDAAKIIAASAPFNTKGGEARQLGIAGSGVSPFIYNTPANYDALMKAGLKFGDEKEWGGSSRGRAKPRGRSAPAAPVAVVAPSKDVRAANARIMKFHDEMAVFGIVVPGDFIAAAVAANPKLTADQLRDQWRSRGRLVPRSAPIDVAKELK